MKSLPEKKEIHMKELKWENWNTQSCLSFIMSKQALTRTCSWTSASNDARLPADILVSPLRAVPTTSGILLKGRV